jgi:hypothetical protein
MTSAEKNILDTKKPHKGGFHISEEAIRRHQIQKY